MDIKKTVEAVKTRVVAGGRIVDREVEKHLRRTHLVPGDALLMQECVAVLVSVYGERGYATQSFRFVEDGTVGALVQIGNTATGWKQKIVTTIGGQQIAVNVRLFPKGDDIEVSIDCGKWVDKALSGVLAWAVFAPLLMFPIVGLWRQKSLIDRVERETLEWLAARRRAGCIDV